MRMSLLRQFDQAKSAQSYQALPIGRNTWPISTGSGETFFLTNDNISKLSFILFNTYKVVWGRGKIHLSLNIFIFNSFSIHMHA